MSIWSKLLGFKQTDETSHKVDKDTASLSTDTSRYTFVDVEIGLQDHKIHMTSEHSALTAPSFIKHPKKNCLTFCATAIISADTISSIMMPNTCLPAGLVTGHWSIRFMYLLYYSPNVRITDW